MLSALTLCGLASLATPSDESRPGLILGLAHFEGGKPLPGRIILARPGASGVVPWGMEIIDVDDKSNVIHKAMYFEPAKGEPGILSISATPPIAKIWRKKDGKWTPETVFEGVVGKTQNRLRDVEVGDVNGDGVKDLVIVTHDCGVVLVIDQKDGKYVPKEIDRNETHGWIHEVELGDVDGDGTMEIFATPSAPNKLDGSDQPGEIVMYKFKNGSYEKTEIEAMQKRHAKEILCVDFDKDGKPELFSSIEGEGIGGTAGGAGSAIRLHRYKDGRFEGQEIAALPGKLCRFLNMGDTNGDGNPEIVASTSNDGIHAIEQVAAAWKTRLIAPGSFTSGFEHATILLDLDGDKVDEVLAVSDKKKQLNRFYWDKTSKQYKTEKLLDIPGQSMFVFNLMPLPSGM